MSEHGWPGWPDDSDDQVPDPEHDDPEQVFPDLAADLHPMGDPGDWVVHTPHWAAPDVDDPPVTEPGPLEPAGDDGTVGDGASPYRDPAVELAHDGLIGPVGADPDAVAEPAPGTDLPFPAPVHVGDLPEPVDGFPWIDTATLGTAPVDTAVQEPAGVHSAELAAYAQTQLPAGADGWAALVASDDPATSALARFWAPRPPTG